MINRIISLLLVISNCISGAFSQAADFLLFPSYEMTESIQFAQSLGSGWNLGNTFEACEKHSTEKAGLETETMWGNPETTKELFAFVKECGFDSIRIPVTWAQHMGDAPDYTIDPAWLDRINQVVDWVLELDMKVIINVHHDDAFWLITDNEHADSSEYILRKIWSQLCERFASYGENLVFETMNEPRVVGAQDEWSGNPETRAVVNRLNFAALDTIRNGGGNNKTRFVIIPTYACSGLDENIDALALPDDSRVIVTVHYYFGTAHQSEFADNESKWSLSEKFSLYKTFRRMHKRYIAKGYGVVKSEFGWTDRTNLENLAANAEFYVELAKKFGFPCMVWDNGSSFELIDRINLTQKYPEYIEAIT
ncbi:MAG: glycoside hydrolase family 5 protein [Clostridia bacterium]|nr:glycoside hydrolase family 5 protein [Clostridia bacterium]